jgi:hypothetical protein
MRWVGEGSELWHVRVDLLAPDDDSSRVSDARRSLLRLLVETDGGAGYQAAVDQGTGVEGQAVLGLSFWVRADDVGSAATVALSTARSAAAGGLAGPEFYDVVVVPRSAVRVPEDEHHLPMPD